MSTSSDHVEFWEEQHRQKDGYWLTGTKPENVLEMHSLDDPDGLRVMDIGVGTGVMCKHLSEKNEVTCVDVCQAALDVALANGAVSAVTFKYIGMPAPVDLAICHNTFLHMDNEDMQFILENIRLKPGGIFSFQWGDLVSGGTGKLPEFGRRHYFRGLSDVQLMLPKSQAVVRYDEGKLCHGDGAGIRWHFMQTRRKEADDE